MDYRNHLLQVLLNGVLIKGTAVKFSFTTTALACEMQTYFQVAIETPLFTSALASRIVVMETRVTAGCYIHQWRQGLQWANMMKRQVLNCTMEIVSRKKLARRWGGTPPTAPWTLHTRVNKVKWSTDNASMIAMQNRQRAYNNLPNELFVDCHYGYLNLVRIY